MAVEPGSSARLRSAVSSHVRSGFFGIRMIVARARVSSRYDFESGSIVGLECVETVQLMSLAHLSLSFSGAHSSTVAGLPSY